jgi:hypothetical protein
MLFALIMCSPDGNNHCISNNLESLKTKFAEEKSSESYSSLTLAKIEMDQDFGFGAWSDFYGGEIIEEWDSEAYEDDENE